MHMAKNAMAKIRIQWTARYRGRGGCRKFRSTLDDIGVLFRLRTTPGWPFRPIEVRLESVNLSTGSRTPFETMPMVRYTGESNHFRDYKRLGAFTKLATS